MDDSRVVGGRQGRGDGFQVVQSQHRFEGGVTGDEPAQGLAVDELHDDVWLPLGGALVEDADHRWVVDQGSGAGLPVELCRELVVLGQIGSHDLDRDGPLETGVTRPVDRRHTAPCDLRENFVATIQHASDHRVVGTAFVHRGLLGKIGDLGWAMSSAGIECRPIPERESSGRAA